LPAGKWVSFEVVGRNPVTGGRFGCEGAKCTRATSKAQPFKEAKVSTKNMGLRRVGIVGLSTLVVTSMMSLTGASSFAAIGDYLVVPPVLNVARGAGAAPASNVTLEFANNWGAGATQTFTVGGNDCSTAAGIAKAVGFNGPPAFMVTDPGLDNNMILDTPPFLAENMSSSSGSCAVAGILDVVTFTQAAASTGIITDNWLLTLSSIKYAVGATTPQGNINLATAGTFKASGSVANAFIPIANFTNTARVAAQPGATGVSLGTQTFTETTAGSFFPAASAVTTISLTLNDGATFTSSITPTITVPAGYTATHPLTTLGQNPYVFTVTGPVTLGAAATVTVSGLKTDVGGAISTRTITASGMDTNSPQSAAVVNVLDFGVSPGSRTGGAQRWDTAALLFDQNFGGMRSGGAAILASGLNFPDALSANYLAGKLHTGTLLTATDWLTQAAKVSILSNCIQTVYIMGETAAVSQATQDQVEALTVCNNPAAQAPHVLVIRLGGPDRFATNQLVNEYNFALPPTDTVLMTSGLNFPDALSVGPVAAGRQMPLIITRGTTLGTEENAQLSDFSPANIVIAGGTAVVSQAIQDNLVARGFNVYRLGGADRTLTAALVAKWATVGVTTGTGHITDGLGFGIGVAFVATGSVFADALAAGPVAGDQNSVILLTANSTVLGAGIPSFLGNWTVGIGMGEVSNLHALGLTSALSAAVMQSAAASIDLLN
jgi:putative cell wall-binding protein